MNHKFLVIDAGNTKSKLALCQNGSIISEVSLADHETTVSEALRLARQHAAAGCLLCSVTEGATEMAELMRKGGLPTAILTVDMSFPFAIDYATPRTLGPDRLAGAVAAWTAYPHNGALIIDAGTAITYDFITPDAHFRGGAISPGISMRFRALHAFTAKLPLCNASDWTGDVVGRDTREAIASGVMNGVWAEADFFIKQARAQFPDAVIVVTGGDYKNFDLKSKKGIFASPNLVLQGLALLAQDNSSAILQEPKL